MNHNDMELSFLLPFSCAWFGWLFGFYVGYLNDKSIFMQIVLFQTIQFSIRM